MSLKVFQFYDVIFKDILPAFRQSSLQNKLSHDPREIFLKTVLFSKMKIEIVQKRLFSFFNFRLWKQKCLKNLSEITRDISFYTLG